MLTLKHSLGAVIKNSLKIESAHFATALPNDAAIGLFKRHVELIEIETTSYCNRTCSFCPNSFIDRRSEKHTMPEDTWETILGGLRELDYTRNLVWSRYSEPLSERRITERIKQVRDVAPRARLCIDSNGDYLDKDYLLQLRNSGLSRLWIDIYIPDADSYDLKVAREYYHAFIERIGFKGRITGTEPEMSFQVELSGMDVAGTVRNVAGLRAKEISNRGGTIQFGRRTVRTSPCFAPYKQLTIDWNGTVMLCCQLRSDIPAHRPGFIGRIGSGALSLPQAYAQLATWRESLKSYGKKRGPCATCNVFEYRSNIVTCSLSSVLGNTASHFRNALRRAAWPLIGSNQRF